MICELEKIQCAAYPILDIQIGIKVPQDLSAGQTATDSCRGVVTFCSVVKVSKCAKEDL